MSKIIFFLTLLLTTTSLSFAQVQVTTQPEVVDFNISRVKIGLPESNFTGEKFQKYNLLVNFIDKNGSAIPFSSLLEKKLHLGNGAYEISLSCNLLDNCTSASGILNESTSSPNLKFTLFSGTQNLLTKTVTYHDYRPKYCPYLDNSAYIRYGSNTKCRPGFECMEGADSVSELQRFLAAYFHLPSTFPTGYFGPRTHYYVQLFKKEQGLSPVSTVGPATIAKIKEVCVQRSELFEDTFQLLNTDSTEKNIPLTLMVPRKWKEGLSFGLENASDAKDVKWLGVVPRKMSLSNDEFFPRDWYVYSYADAGCSSVKYFANFEFKGKKYVLVLWNSACDGDSEKTGKKIFSETEIQKILLTLTAG